MKKYVTIACIICLMIGLFLSGCFTEEGPLDTPVWIRIENEKNEVVNFTLTLDDNVFPTISIPPKSIHNLSDLSVDDFPQGIYHQARFEFETNGSKEYAKPGQFKYYCYQVLKENGGFAGGIS